MDSNHVISKTKSYITDINKKVPVLKNTKQNYVGLLFQRRMKVETWDGIPTPHPHLSVKENLWYNESDARVDDKV